MAKNEISPDSTKAEEILNIDELKKNKQSREMHLCNVTLNIAMSMVKG